MVATNKPFLVMCKRIATKYYLDGNLLQEQPKEGISYTWRSIVKGGDLLKGVIKIVEDGVSIQIWTDPWVPRKWPRSPMVPRGRLILRTLHELFDPYIGTWDSIL